MRVPLNVCYVPSASLRKKAICKLSPKANRAKDFDKPRYIDRRFEVNDEEPFTSK